MNTAQDIPDQVKSSLLYWYEEVDDPHQPETVTVEADHWQDLSFGLQMPSLLDEHVPDVREAMHQVGGPPAFLRTPYTSGKYGENGVEDCRLTDDPDKIRHAIRCAVRDHGSFMLPSTPILCIREWLDLEESPAGYPLEFRFLVSQDGEIEGWFDYYFQRDDEHDLAPPPSVFDRARAAADGLEPFDAWSVDFAQDTDGTWWLIDMASRKRSHRPDIYREGA